MCLPDCLPKRAWTVPDGAGRPVPNSHGLRYAKPHLEGSRGFEPDVAGHVRIGRMKLAL